MELKEDGTSKLKVNYDYFKNGWLKQVTIWTNPAFPTTRRVGGSGR